MLLEMVEDHLGLLMPGPPVVAVHLGELKPRGDLLPLEMTRSSKCIDKLVSQLLPFVFPVRGIFHGILDKFRIVARDDTVD